MTLLHIFSEVWALLSDIRGTMNGWMQDYGNWLYGILFLIVFVETGLVVMPLLQGDSLLFTAGVLAADP